MGVAAATAAVVGLLAGLIGGWVFTGFRGGSAGSCDATRVARDVLPSVVTIAAQGPSGSGTGSGAITTLDGVIITNDHVISVAARNGRIDVRLSDGTTKPSTLVGHDPKTDLAVLKVDATNLPVLAIGDATSLQVGQPVIALGAPLGLSNTVTSGIVSALGRDVTAPTGDGGTTVLVGSIQTDASINPGNSGGPLVDCSGRLVGINTAISTVPNASGDAGGGSVGIGFAVPVGTVTTISGQLLAQGRVAHPWLGISTVPVPEAAAQYFNTPTGLFIQAMATCRSRRSRRPSGRGHHHHLGRATRQPGHARPHPRNQGSRRPRLGRLLPRRDQRQRPADPHRATLSGRTTSSFASFPRLTARPDGACLYVIAGAEDVAPASDVHSLVQLLVGE